MKSVVTSRRGGYTPLLVKKIKRRMLKETSSFCVLGKQPFNRALELRVVAASLDEEGLSLSRLERQCSLE